MRLVFILPGPLIPIRNGQQSTGFNLISELSKLVDIQVVLLYRRGTSLLESARATKEHLLKLGIETLNVEIAPSTMIRLLPMFLPACLRSFTFARLLQLPAELEAVYKDSDNISLYFGSSYDLFAHWHVRQQRGAYLFPADSIGFFQNNNLETKLLRRILKPLKRWYANCIERDLYRAYARLIFYVSELDQEYLSREAIDVSSISRIVRIGVNLPDTRKHFESPPKPLRLAFSGVMAYRPNEEAAFYLTDQLMPRLSKEYATLALIGKDPSPELLSRSSDQISITGEVDDVHQHLINSDIFVSPLFSGAGAKNKILSALGCGLPVLGTCQSFSGFASPPPGTFLFSNVEELITLLDKISQWSIQEWREQGQMASNFIRQHFTWEASAQTLLNWLHQDGVEFSRGKK